MPTRAARSMPMRVAENLCQFREENMTAGMGRGMQNVVAASQALSFDRRHVCSRR